MWLHEPFPKHVHVIGNTMGFVAPMIVGYIINDNNDVQHWQVGSEQLTMSRTDKMLLLGSLLDCIRGLHIW